VLGIATVAQGTDMQGCYSPVVQAALSLLLTLGVVSTTQADNGISTTVSGFGTVGGTFTSDGNYAYRHDVTEFVGATNTFDVGLESRLGVQAIVDFGSGFSVTAQEVARRRESTNFNLGTEWLYAQYVPTPDWQFRVGRVVLANFLLSDSREIGYAAQWFRAPNEIYGPDPFNSLDGGQLLWRHNFGEIVVRLQSAYGTTSAQVQFNGETHSTNSNYTFNASASLEYGNFLVRIARTKSNTPTAFPVTATDTLDFNSQDRYDTVGAQYDDGRAIVIGEWAKHSEPNVPGLPLPLAVSTQWYLAGGWRFGKFTPMVIFGDFKPGDSLVEPAANLRTWSVNLRYDVVRNVALKAEISRPQAANGDYWVSANNQSQERVNVYSFGVDFVF
jgi:hypothetical protein